LTIYDQESIDPDAANNSHALLVELVGRDRRVLDVGCSTGYLGEALAARGCIVDGIEKDPAAAELARERMNDVAVLDLDRDDLAEALAGRQYDCVVLADVLEHLADARRVLESAVRLLSPDGEVVISVPNVAHGSLRLALLQGRWEYRDTGLLDRTHIHFFTRTSILDLIQQGGLAITAVHSTVVDPLASEINLDRSSLPQELVDWVRVQEDSFNYQFVIRARRGVQEGKVPPVEPDAKLPGMDPVRKVGSEFQGLQTAPGGRDDLRRKVLTLRDYAIGVEAELDQARRELDKARRHLSEVQGDLTALRRSASWRVGQILVAPLSRIRRTWRGQS